MPNIEKKISYIRGLVDGLGIAEDSDSGKVISKILTALDDLAAEHESVKATLGACLESINQMDRDLGDVTDDVYRAVTHGSGVFGSDFDFDDEDDFYDDEDDDAFDDDSELFELECPACGEDVMIDFDMIDEGSTLVCPNCHKEIELEIDYDDDSEIDEEKDEDGEK